MELKKQLRLKAKNIRKNISDLDEISIKIYENLCSVEKFNNSKKIFAYCSFGDEIQTNKILKDKICFVPKIIGTKMKMCLFDKNNLEKNKYGIYEVKTDKYEEPQDNDIIIVPCLCVDKNGNRLGYGGGYYDRFLAKYKKCSTICLVPDCLVFDEIPTETTDIRVDCIITESRVIKVNKK